MVKTIHSCKFLCERVWRSKILYVVSGIFSSKKVFRKKERDIKQHMRLRMMYCNLPHQEMGTFIPCTVIPCTLWTVVGNSETIGNWEITMLALSRYVDRKTERREHLTVYDFYRICYVINITWDRFYFWRNYYCNERNIDINSFRKVWCK